MMQKPTTLYHTLRLFALDPAASHPAQLNNSIINERYDELVSFIYLSILLMFRSLTIPVNLCFHFINSMLKGSKICLRVAILLVCFNFPLHLFLSPFIR